MCKFGNVYYNAKQYYFELRVALRGQDLNLS